MIHQINFIGVQESELEDVCDIPIDIYWDRSDVEYGRPRVESHGKSGGLFCLWNQHIFQQVNINKNPNFIIIFGHWSRMDGITNIINIYAHVDEIARSDLWILLKSIISLSSGCWLLFGDFNEVRYKRERLSNRGCNSSMEDFNVFIREANILEYKL